MRILVWIVFTVLAAMWTGATVIAVKLSEWVAATVASGQISDAIAAAGQWPVPAWLAPWIDTGVVAAIQQSVLAVVQWLTPMLPSAAGALGWVPPLLWTLWGLGAVALLVIAIGLHWLTGRGTRNRAVRSRAA